MLFIKMLSGLAISLVGGMATAFPTFGLDLDKRDAGVKVGNEEFSGIAIPVNYCQSMLYHVNSHRLNHSAPFISYNRTLEAQVKDYIGACAIPPSTYFPNALALTITASGFPDITDTVQQVALNIDNWYSDPYAQEQYKNLTENFTRAPTSIDALGGNTFLEIIWKAQKSMGCWSVQCGPGTPFFEQAAGPGNPNNLSFSVNSICAFHPGDNVRNEAELTAAGYFENVSGSLGLPADSPYKHNVNSTTC